MMHVGLTEFGSRTSWQCPAMAEYQSSDGTPKWLFATLCQAFVGASCAPGEELVMSKVCRRN